tara:strand:+ start:438 stop:785 length:348 start_codon:yes stop_codon:yes gene_type:complete
MKDNKKFEFGKLKYIYYFYPNQIKIKNTKGKLIYIIDNSKIGHFSYTKYNPDTIRDSIILKLESDYLGNVSITKFNSFNLSSTINSSAFSKTVKYNIFTDKKETQYSPFPPCLVS